MSFHLLEPDVAGGLGNHTIMDTTVHPPVVSHLHYAVDDWSGDELLESTPCFMITQRLADLLNHDDLSGYTVADAEVTVSETGVDLLSDTELPTFRWLQVTGHPGNDDFGLASDASLVVSDAALAALRNGNLDNCDVEDWATDDTDQ